MEKLEQYYKGDDSWNKYSSIFGEDWTDSDFQKELLVLVNNQIDLAKVIYYHNTENSINWLNSKVPALNYLTPLECLKDIELTKRLKVCLMRIK
ncbi:hypothetical protein ACFO5T_10890 [Dokdonia genika]|uniref:Antitoxin Xre/MbcA/ParS-like toxin-binding domain-containing protein n=1 Tax=Dokdonia genika TaxID=308113 RepID=A0ABV9LBJ0_9FLAO